MASQLLRRSLPATSSRLAPLQTARTYATAPYPFSKDPAYRPAPQAGQVNKTPYPFTKPSDEPTKISPPSNPLGDAQPVSVSASEHHDAQTPHQIDWNVARDYRISSYSPMPMRVQDGSEDNGITPAAVLSGAPTELQARTVRIYRPAKTATQSGDWHGHHWQMDWDVLGKGHRWENPLMGWQSSGDFMQATRLNFKSKDDAIRFAEKQGYEYFVQEPNSRRRIPKAYASQFEHVPGRLKTVRTK